MLKRLLARTLTTFLSVFILSTTLTLNASNSFFENPTVGRFVLPPSLGRDLLQQCSRPTPKKVIGAWLPSESVIDELETALTKYLEARRKANQETPPDGKTYHRQYMGFTRGSERFIYGNFYPASAVKGVWKGKESRQAFRVCDGGPAFWGIVYRLATKKFEDIEFNGLG